MNIMKYILTYGHSDMKTFLYMIILTYILTY